MNNKTDNNSECSTEYLQRVFDAVSAKLNPSPQIILKIAAFNFVYDIVQERFNWSKGDSNKYTASELKARIMNIFKHNSLDAYIDNDIFVVCQSSDIDPNDKSLYVTKIDHNALVAQFRELPLVFDKFKTIYRYDLDKEVTDDMLQKLELTLIPDLPQGPNLAPHETDPFVHLTKPTYIVVGKHKRLFKLDDTGVFYYLCNEDEEKMVNHKVQKKYSKEHCLKKFNNYFKAVVFFINREKQLVILSSHAEKYLHSPAHAHYIKMFDPHRQNRKRKHPVASFYSVNQVQENNENNRNHHSEIISKAEMALQRKSEAPPEPEVSTEQLLNDYLKNVAPASNRRHMK